MERKLSTIFGLLIGAMWIGEVLLGNLGGTSIFGNLRGFHPHVYALGPWLALSAVGVTAMGGAVAAYQTRSIGVALRVGLWSGLISGVIALVTIVSVVVLFHDAVMKDPSNIHEFARGAHHVPSEAELPRFIHADGLAGGVNHLWIGPLLGVTVGGVGAVMGKLQRRFEEMAQRNSRIKAT
jgi:hypothetical protein